MKKLIALGIIFLLIIAGAWAIFTLYGKQKAPELPKIERIPPQETGSGEAADLWTRSDQGEGNVTAEVTYATQKYFQSTGEAAASEKYGLDKNLAFIISLSTHSVDLSSYALDTLTYLRDDQGNEYSALPGWEAKDDSSHHRSGVLKFAKFDAQGRPVIRGDTKFIEVIIKNVAGVSERIFRWESPLEK